MIFASGLIAPEGPTFLEDGSLLVVEMGSNRGCITRISPDGRNKQIVAKTGRPNGLAVDEDGIIWAAESSEPALLRVTQHGKVDLFVNGCEGEPFLFPNDLTFGPDGALYMTDSGILYKDFAPGGKAREDWRRLYPEGRVYRIDTKTKNVEKLDSGIRFSNGIAFSPEGDLYVNESLTGSIFRYGSKGGKSGLRKLFGNVLDPTGPDVYRGPDGMKFSSDGRLWVTVYGQGVVTVLGRDGSILQKIRTEGMAPTNLAFGPRGEKRIYVTEVRCGQVEVFEVDAVGLVQ